MSDKITVVSGANSQEFKGMTCKTVGEIKDKLADILNIDGQAEAYVNGERVDANYEVKNGDQIEFIKSSGTKGC